jgi:hypothetical protein
MKTKKTAKFALEKFEVAKLKNLQKVKGGDIGDTNGDPETITQTSKLCGNGSGIKCLNP